MATDELEFKIIGMLINSDDKREYILQLLDKYRFTAVNRIIVKAIKEMANAKLPVDNVSLTVYMQEAKKYSQQTHEIILNTSLDYISAANCEYYCKKLLEQQLTSLIKNAESLVDMQEIKELQDFITNTEAEEEFSQIGEGNKDIDHYFETIGKTVKTGYPDIDDIIKGFYDGEFIVIAAATGAGKTAFALNVCKNIAKQDKNILFISLEMSKRELRKRLNCSEIGLNSLKVRGHELTASETEKYFCNMEDSINKLPVYVNKDFNITIPKIEAYAKQLKSKNNLDIIIIDYLTLLTTNDRFTSKREEVCYLTRGLKLLARNLNVPIICLSQLSRATDTRQNKRPILSDLKESSSIEQDADIVMFLYRDDYYFPDTDKKGVLEVAIAKARDCPTGVAELNFNKQYQSITSKKRFYE